MLSSMDDDFRVTLAQGATHRRQLDELGTGAYNRDYLHLREPLQSSWSWYLLAPTEAQIAHAQRFEFLGRERLTAIEEQLAAVEPREIEGIVFLMMSLHDHRPNVRDVFLFERAIPHRLDLLIS